MSTTPSYRRQLNTHQIQLLITLYKFRFITPGLIKDSQQANYIQVINSRLKILYDQGYITRHYDSSYKLQGKQAVYYLSSKGIQYLKTQAFANPKVINALYHDRRRTDDHINHCLNVFRVYIQLKQHYSLDNLKFYSKSELYNHKGLPKLLPDAKIVITDKTTQETKHYFLNYIEQSSSYAQNIALIKRHIAFTESRSQHKQQTDQTMPNILLVCENKLLQRRMTRLASKQLETTYVDLEFIATTQDQLIGSLNS